MTLYTWSKTAASNSNADATINWAEGQAPSSVNDSARAVMAAAAKFRDDISGSLLTTNTSTAYNLTTNQVFSSLSAMDGMAVRTKFHVANGASPTLNVDSLGAKNIVLVSGTNVPTGIIVANACHDLVYSNASGVWILVGPYNAAFDAGTVMLFQQTAAPTGWTKSATHNDKALRIVSGTASSGGSTAFTSIFAARTIAQANLPNVNLTGTPNVGSQTLTHLQSGQTAIVPNSGAAGSVAQSGAGSNGFFATGVFAGITDHGVNFPTYTVSLGGSGSTMDFAVQYVDVIAASKN
jgi:hypothetical protein